MTLRNRLVKLEASRATDPRAEMDKDLWPLIGSTYRHEDFIELLAREAAASKKGVERGNT